MNVDLSSEELEILKEELNQAVRRLEIEKSRSDKIDYHRMLAHRADVLEGVYKKLVGEPAPM